VEIAMVPAVHLHLLLVEDNAGDARLIREFLREAGLGECPLEEVEQLQAAVERLRSGGLDLVLLDLSLPDSQGLDTVRRVVQAAPSVPVVVLTGLDDQHLAAEALAAGAQDYLIKHEINPVSLARVIRYALDRKRGENERRQAEEELKLLRSLALKIEAAQDLTSALSTCLEDICRATGWAVGEAWLPGAEDEVIALRVAHTEPHPALERFQREGDHYVLKRGEGLPGRVWEEKVPVWIPDVMAAPEFTRASFAAEAGLKAAFGIPVLAGDQVVAVLLFLHFDAPEQDERLVGLISAVAAQLGALVQRRRAEDAYREVSEQYEALLNNIPDKAWVKDTAGRYLTVNPAYTAILGRTRNEILGQTDFDLHPQAVAEAFRAGDERTLALGERQVSEERARGLHGEERWFETVRTPLWNDAGQVVGTVGIARDVTQRKRAEERERLLARSGEILTTFMDEHERLRNLVRLVVPRLADWCEIDLLRPDDSLEQVEVVAADPRKEAIVREAFLRYSHGRSPVHEPVRDVLSSGAAVLLSEITPEMIEASAEDEEYRKMLRELAPVSSIIVPMVADGRILGAITIAAAESGRRFDATDLELMEEVARRAALAVQNARLYRIAQNARERVARLQEVTAALSEALTPVDVARVLVCQGAKAVDAVFGALVLLNASRTEFEIVLADGLSEELHAAWRTFPADAVAPVCDSVRLGEPLFFETEEELVQKYPEFIDKASLLRQGAGAVIPLPERGSGQAGALAVGYDQWRTFSGEDRELLIAVTRQAGLALERARLYERERRAVLERDQVLGVVAHDLRNPLGAIQLYAQILWDSLPKEDRARGYATTIQRLTDQADRLIQDLLEVNRIEAGQLWVNPRTVSAAALVTSALNGMALAATEKGVTVETGTAKGKPSVMADPDRIAQLFSNLIGNAIKYTPPGGRITVEIDVRDGEARFSILDSGIGIAPEHLPHLFDRFWQVNRTSRAGAGLGLSIAKGIVEAHGGRMGAESEFGVGSTFWFTLPLTLSAPEIRQA